MYDYKQPRRSSKVSPRRSTSLSTRQKKVTQKMSLLRPKISSRPVARRAPRTPSTSEDSDWRLIVSQFIIGIAAVGLIIITLVYVGLTQVAPTVLPLTQPQTLVLITKAAQAAPPAPGAIEVINLDPTTHMISVTTVVPTSDQTDQTDAMALATAGEQGQRGWVSLKLGKLVDQVSLLATDTPLASNRSQALHQLRQLISAKTSGIAWQDKLRWWLFGITVPDARWQIKKLDTIARLQDWMAKLSRPSGLHCSVALINTTTVTGLSNNMSQVLEQSGYQVVRVDSQPLVFQLSQFMISPSAPADCQALVAQLNQLLPAPVHQETNTIFPTQNRSDVVWFLGKDIGDAVVSLEPAASPVPTPKATK